MVEDDEYFLPLQDQQVFGAGIRRDRVPFVHASESEPTASSKPTGKPGLGDRYLSIVLPQSAEDGESPRERSLGGHDCATASGEAVCAVCKLPITSTTSNALLKPHESSVAHQVCLSHSHPPSHLDRRHMGLKYLVSYGWNPDARSGLGVTGTGITVPVKGKVKNDTVGLGVKPNDRIRVQKEAKEKSRLNAKQVRKQDDIGKKREMQLRNAFYGNDLEKYLGPFALGSGD